MILKPGETYKVEFKYLDGDKINTLHIKEIVRHTYMQGGTLVGSDFQIITEERDCYLIPERNVGMYQTAPLSSSLCEWLALESSDCGLFTFLSGGGSCTHQWVETGLKWTYCKLCDKKGWNHMGVITTHG